ncbi:MAG: hypothetical protein HN742_35100 [Lentisphaerae bacterium]|jgi:hypothetical protein|nr:hypothetical protein [Lentisphaerota bacterium]MBT4819716.1 hypothetical protein [Lentisphaerota bacterium]MBT5609202.1 hypothetical protein [Lentisphaerota bacterium]MBT7055187.1 hypothetical protein [Lentisphaerota bacterium]MBT7847152.1 hypothetical protein [Lentisphaerota bacterium]
MSHRKYSIAMAFVLAGAALSAARADGKPFPPAPQWDKLGTVDIVPCPKWIEFSDTSLRLSEGALFHLSDADGCLARGAEEIAAGIAELGGGSLRVNAVADAAAAVAAVAGPAIIIGYGHDRLPLPDVEHTYGGISVWGEGQGYVVTTRELNGHGVVVIWGSDPRGALYGCITLRHLLKHTTGGVGVTGVTIVDWPDFKQRVTSGFFGARDDTEGEIAKSIEVAQRFIRRAALLKCNAISAANHWTVRAKLDYLRECDLRLLERLIPYAKSYGVRFHIQHFTSVGTSARDKGDSRYADVPNLRGWYMSWSHQELIGLSMERFRNEARRIGANTDWFFHYPDVHEGGWAQRSKACRERWGDDHAAADAHFGNELYQTMREASPTSRISLCCYPYGLDLELPGNVRTRQYFRKISGLLPEDVLLVRREGTRAAFRSWWRNIRQPIRLAWSPRTFWGARALAPDMAFVKSGWRGDPRDGVEDCLTVYSRPVLDVSGYTFAEYAWNVNAPGSGVWQADPLATKKVVPPSTSGDSYVFEKILAPDGESSWAKWVYLGGRREPKAFNHDLIDRCCRLIYGRDVAPAMAEALRYAPLVQESKWSSDPDIAVALAESAERSFQALVPLWGQEELFGKAPGSEVDTHGVYTQMVKVNTDLRAILGVRAAKISADALLDQARDAVAPAQRQAAAQAAESSAVRGLERLRTARRELRDDYKRYGLEGKPWYMLLAAGYRTCDEVEKKLDTYAGGFRLVQEEADALRNAPASGARPRDVLVPKAAGRITIDGDVSDWELLNPVAVGDESCSAHTGLRPAGNSDGSAVCYFAWDRKYLYLLAKVVDDDRVRAGEEKGSVGDALCFWLNGTHVAIGTSASGTAQLTAYAGIPLVNAVAAIRGVPAHDLTCDVALMHLRPGEMHGEPGYVVEARLPWEPLRIRPEAGEPVRLAVGIRDVDRGEERSSTIVFPPTFKPTHSGGLLTDFSRATLTDETPIDVDLVDLRKEDRTMQLGTDSFVHGALALESPIDLSGLRVHYVFRGVDGRSIASGLVPGVPGILRASIPWRSEPFEINAGPARKRVPLVLTVIADGVGARFEATVE